MSGYKLQQLLNQLDVLNRADNPSREEKNRRKKIEAEIKEILTTVERPKQTINRQPMPSLDDALKKIRKTLYGQN